MSDTLETESLIECPKCDNTSIKGRYNPVCYLNSTKMTYYCHRCKATGKAEELDLEKLNVIDIRTKSVFDHDCLARLSPLNDTAIRYLSKRFPGASTEELNQFGLAYSPERHAIAIPNYLKGELVGVKYRSIDAKSYTGEAGSQVGGYWLLAPNQDKLLIVEGELDAIAGRLLGFEGTIVALQTNKISQETLAESRNYRHVFLALDNDDKGYEGSEAIRRALAHTVLVTYPEGVKDLNELYQKEGRTKASEFLRLQTLSSVEKATARLHESMDELVTYLSNTRNTRGDSTGWPAIDELLGGGLRPQEMTVVHSYAKAGKTTFILNLTHNLTKLGKKVAIASFEMHSIRQLFPSLLSIAGQIDIRSLNNKQKLIEALTLMQTECRYLWDNVTTFKNFGNSSWEEIKEWAQLQRKQGAEYLVLDHAGFCVSKMTDPDENQDLAKNIKLLTLENDLHVLVVVQAPKTKDGLSIQSTYGGMAWGMNADNFLILERSKKDINELQVKLEASRCTTARPSYDPILLFYNPETCTLTQNQA